MSSALALSPTSYIVLGLLEAAGPSTPYALKQGVAASIGNFWSVPHSQLYLEPARLTRAGYATEEREPAGRRRRTYAITDRGRTALREWLADAETAMPELRDEALLKLFFGAAPAPVAALRAERHRAMLAEYEQLHAALAAANIAEARGALLTLEAGIEHSKVWIEFWDALAG